MEIGELILDADICMKLGRFVKLPFIELIIPKLTKKAYIHKYVYKDEILTPKSAKDQIDKLVNAGIVEILHEDNLSPADRMVFEATKNKLKWAMVGTKEKGKNWGEVLSLSMAKTLGMPVFMTDERDLQAIIDRNLNTGTPYDINMFRVIDLILWIKSHPDCGINRKTAQAVWISAGKDKDYFQTSIWKI